MRKEIDTTHTLTMGLRNTAESMSVSHNVKHGFLIGYGNFTLRHVTGRTENI